MKKLVVITGASSGFGKEMAFEFSEAGHPLLLIGRRTHRMEEYNLPNTIIAGIDVRSYDDFETSILSAEEKYGRTDLLINNAGVMLLGNIWEQNSNEWKDMLDINVLGVLNGTKIVLKDMLKRNSGTIINISSIAGKKTFLNHAAYCASKYGVHALTETVREEVSGSDVRVMLIAPGAAETELLNHTTSQSIKDNYNEWKETMGGKSLDPIHIAKSASFMYNMPQNVNIRELVIAATKQNS